MLLRRKVDRTRLAVDEGPPLMGWPFIGREQKAWTVLF